MKIEKSAVFAVNFDSEENEFTHFTDSSCAQLEFTSVDSYSAIVNIDKTEMNPEDLKEAAALFLALAKAIEEKNS